MDMRTFNKKRHRYQNRYQNRDNASRVSWQHNQPPRSPDINCMDRGGNRDERDHYPRQESPPSRYIDSDQENFDRNGRSPTRRFTSLYRSNDNEWRNSDGRVSHANRYGSPSRSSNNHYRDHTLDERRDHTLDERRDHTLVERRSLSRQYSPDERSDDRKYHAWDQINRSTHSEEHGPSFRSDNSDYSGRRWNSRSSPRPYRSRSRSSGRDYRNERGRYTRRCSPGSRSRDRNYRVLDESERRAHTGHRGRDAINHPSDQYRSRSRSVDRHYRDKTGRYSGEPSLAPKSNKRACTEQDRDKMIHSRTFRSRSRSYDRGYSDQGRDDWIPRSGQYISPSKSIDRNYSEPDDMSSDRHYTHYNERFRSIDRDYQERHQEECRSPSRQYRSQCRSVDRNVHLNRGRETACPPSRKCRSRSRSVGSYYSDETSRHSRHSSPIVRSVDSDDNESDDKGYTERYKEKPNSRNWTPPPMDVRSDGFSNNSRSYERGNGDGYGSDKENIGSKTATLSSVPENVKCNNEKYIDENAAKGGTLDHDGIKCISFAYFQKEHGVFKRELVAEMMNILEDRTMHIKTLNKKLEENIHVLFNTDADVLQVLEQFDNCFNLRSNPPGFVSAKASIKLCFSLNCNQDDACKDDCVHVCKYYLLGQCTYNNCEFNHDMFTLQNTEVFKNHFLHRMSSEGVRRVVRQLGNRNKTTIPTICKFYNNEGGCRKGFKCLHLHLCKHFVSGTCKFNFGCKRSHSFLDDQPLYVLKQYGLSNSAGRDDSFILRKLLNDTLVGGSIKLTRQLFPQNQSIPKKRKAVEITEDVHSLKKRKTSSTRSRYFTEGRDFIPLLSSSNDTSDEESEQHSIGEDCGDTDNIYDNLMKRIGDLKQSIELLGSDDDEDSDEEVVNDQGDKEKQATPDGRIIDQHATTDGRNIDQHATTDGQNIDQQATTDGRNNDQQATTDGRNNDQQATTDGRNNDQQTTTDGRNNDQKMTRMTSMTEKADEEVLP